MHFKIPDITAFPEILPSGERQNQGFFLLLISDLV
jgi:hypothetical protein